MFSFSPILQVFCEVSHGKTGKHLLEADFQILIAKTLGLCVTRELKTRRQSSKVDVEHSIKSYTM